MGAGRIHLEAVREDCAAKRAKLAEDKAALNAAYEACLARRDAAGNCQCGPECAMAKMVRCPVCKEIKKGRCRVAACQGLEWDIRLLTSCYEYKQNNH